jgi:AraC-like DNA-binding protein
MDRRTHTIWECWREQIWSTYVRLETASEDDQFYGRVQRPNPASARVSRVISTRQVTERTPSHLRSDPQELLIVAVQIVGEGFIEQDGRRSCLKAGDFGFYDTTRPYRLAFDGPFEQLILRLPRRLIDQRLPTLNRLTGRRYDGRTGAGQVAIGFVRQLAVAAVSLDDSALESFEGATAEVLATAIRLAEAGEPRGERARLEHVQARLLQDLADPSLDIESFAAREGFSVRSLQRLFQLDGTTFTRWLLRRRLERVADDLKSHSHRHRSITDIALSWGFNDMSHFSRAFRETFAASARDWRRSGRHCT